MDQLADSPDAFDVPAGDARPVIEAVAEYEDDLLARDDGET